MIQVNFFYEIKGEDPIDPEIPEDFFQLTAAENLAAHIYYAKNSLNANREVAKKGDSIIFIPDLKGGLELEYQGIPSPTLTQAPPIYDGRELGSISFDNEPLTYYDAMLPVPIMMPYEVSFIMVSQPGTPHEAYCNNWGGYIGDAGNQTRLMHAGNTIAGSGVPEKFHYDIIHAKFDLTRADLWIGGEYKGYTEYPEEADGRYSNMIGVNTNNAQWEFIANHVFNRELTESERNQFFSEMTAKFKIGQEKQLPYAKDAFITRSGNTFTANYTYRNPLGYAEDTTETIYRWVGLGDGWLSNQAVLDGKGNSINLSEIRSDVIQLKVEIQVFDSHGNTWKRIASNWLENIR